MVAWIDVTIPRRPSGGLGMPAHCVYCYGPPATDLTLRARRVQSASKGTLTRTLVEEHLAVAVPYCTADAARSARLRGEIRRLGLVAAAVGWLIGFVVLLLALDAPIAVRIVFGLIGGVLLGLLALLGVGAFVRRLPRYREWGAGLLGVDLVAGADALTFRFTNPTFAATFRTRNGLR
ncbi:MAG TPA: hypothetical protein VFD32_00290 [Dehalococcoidia bacterium]|nr:hypothetical protein [Dehalococcoidia bacterium]